MYRPFRGQAFYYILFILPMLTVPIVIAYTGEMLLYQKGPVNGLLSSILGHQVNILWLANADTALLTVMVLEVWNWVPFSFIIMMAGLAALPDEPIEAAKILGASKWRIFVEIQLPLLRPVIVLALILRFLEAMAEFPKTWSLFQGGPGSATETIPTYLYIITWHILSIVRIFFLYSGSYNYSSFRRSVPCGCHKSDLVPFFLCGGFGLLTKRLQP